jgi:pteridine reductase
MARPVALVTGAGQRVGRSIALALAADGHDLIVHYHRSADGARETIAAATALGVSAIGLQADLSDGAAAAVLATAAHGVFGRLDVVVNSAALWRPRPLAAVTPADWDAIHAVNLRAPFFLAIAAAPLMTDGGVIINIADHLAHESWPGLVPHSISKAGVVALTQQLAQQLAPRLRVNAVSPGAVLPPPGWTAAAQAEFVAATPLQRMGAPDDVAAAIVYLVHARYVTGVVLPVDGGRHLGH